MTEPTEQRIEAAWHAIRMDKDNRNCGVDPCDKEDDGMESCVCWRKARAALTADAPFAASEYERGLRDAREIAFRAAFTHPSDEACQMLDAIDARLSALKDGGT